MAQVVDVSVTAGNGHQWGVDCRQFGVRVLRGIGQVTFVSRALTGVLFACALFTGGWGSGVYGVGGAALGTGLARVLGVERERLAQGLEGFNSCLVGVGCAALLGPARVSTVLVALLACAVVTVATAAAGRVLGACGLPALTSPFCAVVTMVALIRPHGSGAGYTAGAPGLGGLGRGFLAGFGQIFLLPHWYAGAFVLAGLAVAGLRVAGVACLGNAVGMAVAWGLGAAVHDGTGGYNAVLVSVALCGVFLPFGGRTLAYALVGAVAATALAPVFGTTVFTWPFVVTTLVFLGAARSFPALSRPTPATGSPNGSPRLALSHDQPRGRREEAGRVVA
ncbi:urea transporter [Streptomyces sp. NBC_01465]|uniref:urea transporter n=1 Tax=Streptomyces sp. NBC_01465 TaxID=2903878 RepID=UPI002E372436|nr:urea transporter [Streptomyces sp. NBC_01465]